MPAEINFKKKYVALKERYINDIDIAFRLGVEQGMQYAQQQQALDAQAQVQEQKMKMEPMQSVGHSSDQPVGEEGENAPPGQEAGASEMEGQQSSELDAHINKLQSMLSGTSDAEIQKSLNAIISLRKSEKAAIEMKKAEKAIAGIAKALHKPALKFGVQASHNLQESGKQALSLQHKIVNDVMKAWADEEARASKDIKSVLNLEHVLED